MGSIIFGALAAFEAERAFSSRPSVWQAEAYLSRHPHLSNQPLNYQKLSNVKVLSIKVLRLA